MRYTEIIINALLKSDYALSFFVLDKNLCYLEYSESHINRLKLIWGIEPKIGVSILDVFQDHKTINDIKNTCDRVFEKETVTQIDTRKIANQNRKLFIETVWSPIIENNEVTGIVCIAKDLTESETVKNNLEKYETIFEAFFNQKLDGSLIVILEEPIVWNDQINHEEVIEQILDTHRVIRVNQAYLDQYGYKEDQILNRSAREIYQTNIQEIKSFWLKLLDEKQIHREKKQIHKNGKEFWVKSEYHIFYDNYGRILGYFGSQLDITESKKLQLESINVNKRLQYIIENDSNSIAIFDRDMKYLYVSKNYLHDHNKMGMNIIGQSHYDIFPNLDESFKVAHTRALNGEIVVSEKSKMVYDDGNFDWIRWECRPWFEDDNAIGGMILRTERISDRIRMADELRKREASLSAMFEQAAVGMSYGPYTLLTNVNQKYCEIVGYTKDELTKLSFMEITHPEDIKKDEDTFNRLLKGELSTYTIEKRLIRKDNEIIWINLTVSIVPQSEGEVYVLAVIEDINERKNAELNMNYLNYHDQLTGCLNRRSYEETIKLMDKKEYYPLSLVMVDADGLKLINDTIGHLYGDQLLISIANGLKDTVQNLGKVFRIGGDEFLILLDNCSYEDSLNLIHSIDERLETLSIREFNISVSCGSATKTIASQSIMDIFSQAEDIMYREKLKNSQNSIQKTLNQVLKVLFERSEFEKSHANNVLRYCTLMADALHYSNTEKELLIKAAFIHDIGKIGIDTKIIEKKGKLALSEMDEIKRHVEIGYRILNASNYFSDISLIVLTHHERWDGKGYPKGIKGNDIPLNARIIAIAEMYDVLISKDSYKDRIQKSDAFNEILNESGKHFDPELVIKFVETIGKAT